MKTESNQELDLLLEEIRDEVWATRHLTGLPVLPEPVMDAMREVARDEFVPKELRQGAFANHPLPIGYGQTISQPYIVALMTALIHPRPNHVVLEVGTGSGYQAAILSRLVKQVYSIEILSELAAEAEERLGRLGYRNVEVRGGDGRLGWPEHAPFDAILVAAAPLTIPAALVEQLKPGGSLIIPVGEQRTGQDLRLLTKQAGGRLEQRSVLPVAFVPLTGRRESGR